jgi:mono/diheme cytochrome c family protein
MTRPTLALVLVALALGACYHLAQLRRRRAEAAAPAVYAERCSTCHGERGRGDGPGGASFDPRPRNFADPAWQQSISDERIRLTIHSGGAALGKSPMMPAQPDLDDATLDALVAYIRQVGARSSAAAP